MQQTIQPGDQMWVNIAELIHSQAPDLKGNVLPADLASGTYDVQQTNSDPGSLSLGSLAVDQTWGYQITPPTAICCSDEDASWDPDNFDLFLTETGQASIDAVNSCTGTLFDLSPSVFTWASDNTSVAIVTEQQVEAVGVGTTTGTATGDISEGVGGYCALRPVQLNTGISVGPQVPTSLKVLPDTKAISLTYVPPCNDSLFGIAAAIHYQVLDQNGAPISASTMEPQEEELNLVFDKVSQGNPMPDWGDIGPSSYPGTSQFTDANGQFWDAPHGSCATSAYTLTEQQPISVLQNGTRYTVRTNNWSESSSSAGHGTKTNGVDITVSR
jgi:hypothetical protein